MFSLSIEGNRNTVEFQKLITDLQARYNHVKIVDNFPSVPWFPVVDEDLRDRLFVIK